MSTPSINPFSALFVRWCELERRRDVFGLGSPMGRAMEDAFSGFLTDGWKENGLRATTSLAELPEATQARIRASVDEATAGIETALAMEDTQQAYARLGGVIVWAGERVASLAVAGEPDLAVRTAAALMSERLQSAHMVLHARDVAVHSGVDPVHLGPAAVAGIVAGRIGREELPANVVLKRYGVADGATAPRAQKDAAESFSRAIRAADYMIAETLARHSEAVGQMLAPSDDDEAADIRRVVAVASHPGASDDERVQQIHAFLRATREAGEHDASATAADILHDERVALLRAARSLEDEAAVERELERHWQEIDRELKYMRRPGKKGPRPAVPLPDTIPPLRARAMYYQEAALKGVPLGALLAEMALPRDGHAGPTELSFLQRAAFGAARRYATRLAHKDHKGLKRMRAEDSNRADRVIALAAVVERDVRAAAAQGADPMDAGQDLVEAALQVGEIDSPSAAILTEVMEEVIARIHAEREVSILTATAAGHSEIPSSLLSGYHDLPHSAHVFGGAEPRVKASQVVARNGEVLSDLEADTAMRWKAHRSLAPSGQDVDEVPAPRVQQRQGMDPRGRHDRDGGRSRSR